MVKIQAALVAALSILNTSGATPGATEKVAALVARATCSGASHSSAHNASQITHINYWQNCTEGVWWPWYIMSGIWFQDDFWEASLLCFQSNFSTAWYLEEVWQVFHYRLLPGWCFRGFVLSVLEYYSAVWCSAADTHLKPLDRVVCGASFLTVGVFECDLAHRRYVTLLCMLYKIRCNPMLPLYCALPVSYVSVRVTRSPDRTSVHLCAS